MNVAALMTSAGVNIGLCILFFSLYSILRKQPGNYYVYFPRKLAKEQANLQGSFSLERLVPSASWIMEAWKLSEQELLTVAGLDAVVFLRIFIFRGLEALFLGVVNPETQVFGELVKFYVHGHWELEDSYTASLMGTCLRRNVYSNEDDK
eukprot:Gb_06755 [translate_table: standard]